VQAFGHTIFSALDYSILYKRQEELLYAPFGEKFRFIIYIYLDESPLLSIEKLVRYFIEDNLGEFQ
jgi:hypothetical protein